MQVGLHAWWKLSFWRCTLLLKAWSFWNMRKIGCMRQGCCVIITNHVVLAQLFRTYKYNLNVHKKEGWLGAEDDSWVCWRHVGKFRESQSWHEAVLLITSRARALQPFYSLQKWKESAFLSHLHIFIPTHPHRFTDDGRDRHVTRHAHILQFNLNKISTPNPFFPLIDFIGIWTLYYLLDSHKISNRSLTFIVKYTIVRRLFR